MYSIIGGDSKTYGPVTADEVHRWIREGRADERTKVKEEGSTEWRELGTISAFFPALANVPPKISGRAGLNTVASEGSVHIGDCLRQGWQVYRQDPWRITGIIVIVFVAQFLLNSIPIAGALFAFLLNGPILGGVYFFCMQAIHGQTHGLQDVTSTIKERFLPCFLATTVSSLLAFAPLLVALIPAAGLFAASGVVMEELVKHPCHNTRDEDAIRRREHHSSRRQCAASSIISVIPKRGHQSSSNHCQPAVNDKHSQGHQQV